MYALLGLHVECVCVKFMSKHRDSEFYQLQWPLY